MKKIMVIVFLLFFILPSAHAIPIGIGDFSGSETVIDFDSIAPGEAITKQFDALGVTFSDASSIFQGNPFFERADPSTINGTMSGANFNSSLIIQNPIEAKFTSLPNRVGMFFGTPNSVDTEVQIRAFRGERLLETLKVTSEAGNNLPGGNLATVFGGIFFETGFDRIDFSSRSDLGAFQVDDFRFERSEGRAPGPAPIPESATIVLLCAGLLGLAGFGRKKFFRN